MKEEAKYICENCNFRFKNKEECLKHEKNCINKELQRNEYKKRLKQLHRTKYVFYSRNEEDIKTCLKLLFIDDYFNNDVESYIYPCMLVIEQNEQGNPYDDYTDYYTTVITLESYIEEINLIKKEILLEAKLEKQNMIIKEEIKDLFTVDKKYYLAHCISDDFNLEKGIALEFKKRFKMDKKLKRIKPNGLGKSGCIFIEEDKVFNLITKKVYWKKPSYVSIEVALIEMKDIIVEKGIKHIAMPKIGSGLDRLEWSKVKEVIKEVFEGIDLEILICEKPKRYRSPNKDNIRQAYTS